MDPKNHPDNQNLPVSNRPETIIGVTITFLTVAGAAVLMRLYVRMKQRLWGWDDLFVVLALVAVIPAAALTCVMPSDGLGLHFWTLSNEEIMKYFKHVWASNVCYTMATFFVKMAILVQYLRLFENQRVARKVVWGMLGVTSLWGVAYTCLALFSCKPIKKNWLIYTPGKCIGWGTKDPDTFFPSWIAHNATNMTLDVLILLTPIPFFRQLQAHGKRRRGLVALFVLGGIACSLSLARVIALAYKRIGTVPVFDVTYYTATVYIFSVLEIDVAILCASIPIFWPVIQAFASNKILIVNEIEVRTERRSEAINLTEHGQAGFGEMDFDGNANDGRTSRMSVLVNPKSANDTIEKVHRSGSRLMRHNTSRQHRHKPSNSSSHKGGVGISIGARPSQDSMRDGLNGARLSHQTSKNSFKSTSQGSGLAPSSDNTHARYADKYMQEWAVPDFESRAPAASGLPASPDRTFMAGAERAEMPYDYLKGVEK